MDLGKFFGGPCINDEETKSFTRPRRLFATAEREVVRREGIVFSGWGRTQKYWISFATLYSSPFPIIFKSWFSSKKNYSPLDILSNSLFKGSIFPLAPLDILCLKGRWYFFPFSMLYSSPQPWHFFSLYTILYLSPSNFLSIPNITVIGCLRHKATIIYIRYTKWL